MALDTQERPGIYDEKPVPKNQDADEIRSLEDAFALDSATDADLPDGHPSKSTKQVREAESSADSEDSDGPIKYSGGQRPMRGKSFFSKRKNIAVTAFVSLILSFVTFIATIATGPLQFVHLTNLMDRFHFSSQKENGSSRLMKIAKAVRNRSNPQDNRLSILGNKIADRWEARMRAAGFSPEYNARTGFFERFVIDREAIMKNSQIEGLKNSTNEELRSYFKQNYDIDIDIDINGRAIIDTTGMGYFRTQRLNRLVFNSAGYSKMGSAIRTRTISRRQGITWHPIKKLDNAALKQGDKFLTWMENRKNKLKSGESTGASTRLDAGDTTNDPNAGDGEKVKTATDSVIAEANAAAAESTGSGSSRFSDFANRPSVRATGIATMITGLACMAEGIASEYDSIQYQNSAQPMMRLAADAMATGSQIQATLMQGKPLDIEQLGYLSKSLSKDGQSWLSAKSIQAQAGQEQTGPDIPDEARINIEGSAVSQFLDAIPGLGGACKVVNSGVGQAAGFIFDIATGPASALVGLAAGQTVVPAATDKLLNMITDDPLNLVDAAGGEFGSYVDTGSRLLANESALASGGRELNNTESAELTLRRIALENEELSRLPLATRLFDFTNERSLVGKLAGVQAIGIKNNITRIVQQITNPASSVLSIKNIFQSPTALAATNSYDYGFPQIGFSAAEIENNRFDNSLDPATTAALATASLRERAEKCFGVTIAESSDRTISISGNTPNYKDIAENNCGDTSEAWVKVRFFILDSQIAEAYACYEGVDEAACANIGM